MEFSTERESDSSSYGLFKDYVDKTIASHFIECWIKNGIEVFGRQENEVKQYLEEERKLAIIGRVREIIGLSENKNDIESAIYDFIRNVNPLTSLQFVLILMSSLIYRIDSQNLDLEADSLEMIDAILTNRLTDISEVISQDNMDQDIFNPSNKWLMSLIFTSVDVQLSIGILISAMMDEAFTSKKIYKMLNLPSYNYTVVPKELAGVMNLFLEEAIEQLRILERV